jgi:hypothetical protein
MRSKSGRLLMSIKFSFATYEDKEEWNAVVEKSTYSEIYHTYEWTQLLEKTYNIKVFRLVARINNSTIGILPFIYLPNPIFGPKIVSLPFSDIGGPLTIDKNNNISNRLTKELIKIATKWNTKFIEIRSLQENAEHLPSLNFISSLQAFTYRLNTAKPYNEIWSNYSKKIRHNIKKMKNLGLKIKEAKNAYAISTYYTIYLERMKNFGTPPAPPSFWHNMWKTFQPKGQMKLIFTVLDDKEIAGFTALLFKRKLYFILNVSLREFWKYYGLNELLFDWYIKYACENQYEMVDFGRTRKGTGVQRFKEKGWGTNPIPLNTYCFFLHGRMRNPLETALQTDNIYAKAWKRFIPTTITPILGYLLRKNLGDI